MLVVPFSDMSKSDLCAHGIIAMHQTGKLFKTFYYTKKPRPNSGLILILSDDISFLPTGKERICPKNGDVLYLPEGLHYSATFDNVAAKTILVNFNLRSRNGQSAVLSEDICFCPNSPEIQTLFFEIADIYTNQVGNDLLIKSKLFLLVHAIANSNKIENASISKAILYINNHLMADFSVSDLARLHAMSESTFRREFKLATGTSPVKYITCEKMKKAKQLLRSSDLSINEISSVLGFYDTAYFCKTFRQLFGTTPAQYKSRN